MIKEKNIAVNVILSIVTCGIYGIIWFINLTDDAAYLNDDRDFSGGKSILVWYYHLWNLYHLLEL